MDLPLTICHSNAGYYIGTEDEDGPVSRESGYFAQRDQAEAALATGRWTPRTSP